ncbi:uncharacterized protein [Drosophila takahashii]|uniref:uncharacterized protein n=1 Tax=Drosophila takahashii TaxID=29030 RepID=UPI0007E60596|nr:uncharacterized protein LOC108058470 [Drosophila takahashii]
MPKKVITRRQRKAAESKRKAVEEAQQIVPGLLPIDGLMDNTDGRGRKENPIDAISAVFTAPTTSNVFTEDMSKAIFRRKKKKDTPKISTSAQASNKSTNTVQPCDALQKIRVSSQKKSFLSEVKKRASNLDKVLTKTTIWYEQNNNSLSQELRKLSKPADNINVKTTPNSVFPLMSKICKQIKSHLNTVLPRRNVEESRPQHPKEIGVQRSPDFLLKIDVPTSLEKGHLGSGTATKIGQNNDVEFLESCTPAMDPRSESNSRCEFETPLKVLGSTDFFVLTGTNAQLALQLSDLAARNVVVQSYLWLPSEMMEKVEKQLADLDKNRLHILEKMRNKHSVLGQRRAARH